MTFWTVLSVTMSAGLCVRLLLWSDEHRKQSRFIYRVLLFAVTVYSGQVVVEFLYFPAVHTSPFQALLNTALFVGAFLMKPDYLPWNHINGRVPQAGRSPRTSGHHIR